MDGTHHHSRSESPHIVVIGAGIAGLATTLRLAATGVQVTLLERHDHIGGKIRTVPSPAGPIDAGPTVLTLRDVFDDLFAVVGERLEHHVTLIRQMTLARHFWPDGSQLDLFANTDASIEAIRAFSGDKSARAFADFAHRTAQLFDAFDAPMMRAPAPKLTALTKHVLRNPKIVPLMAPLSTLKSVLGTQFKDPRLRQLFGRYATYVGGAPTHAPGLLALIWHAEAKGVWAIDGGIHKLAQAIGQLAIRHGARVKTGTHVNQIVPAHAGYRVDVGQDQSLHADFVVYAGDPRALATGLLGPDLTHIAPHTRQDTRSFSARVHSFAATPEGLDLSHHNVLFDADPDAEFSDLMDSALPRSPSIYVCAMDRGLGRPVPTCERFEIITNAPACPDQLEDTSQWHPKIMQKMAQAGLSFSPTPTPSSITTETDFATMFPGSQGALYGSSPHGLTSSLRRPTARTPMPGLYLAGGGCHPGAGVPMAAISGQHAAAAIWNDHISALPSPLMATPGGT